jgi:formylmethanofuran dehydrogenase subunit E|tara:strand:+ start:3206 stop:3511 length:306 start_codon:yes stop_codon:yes gene_type:complete
MNKKRSDEMSKKTAEDKLTLNDLNQLREWVDQMYWDWDRMSSSGQETLDKIANKLNLETIEDDYVYNLKCNNCGAMTCAEKAFFYKDETFCEDCCPDGYGE